MHSLIAHTRRRRRRLVLLLLLLRRVHTRTQRRHGTPAAARKANDCARRDSPSHKAHTNVDDARTRVRAHTRESRTPSRCGSAPVSLPPPPLLLLPHTIAHRRQRFSRELSVTAADRAAAGIANIASTNSGASLDESRGHFASNAGSLAAGLSLSLSLVTASPWHRRLERSAFTEASPLPSTAVSQYEPPVA